MNPGNGNELPPVRNSEHGVPMASEQAPVYEVAHEAIRAQAIEQGRMGTPLQQPAVSVPGVQPATPLAQPVALPPAAMMPLMADDIDLIEKEWVTKAKAIVEQTKLDPRMQSREINRVKADYIKRRFNKDVKLEEE